jgi:hypothetical protein
MSTGKAGADDMLGVAVNALREIADEKYPGHGVTVAMGTLNIIDQELPSDGFEWKLVPRGEAAPQPEPDGRWCLLELMGHRQCIGRLAEVTFAGRPMLRISRIDGERREQLYSPESVYGLTWLTEDEAREMAKPWAPLVPVAIGSGWADDACADEAALHHHHRAAETGLDNPGDED